MGFRFTIGIIALLAACSVEQPPDGGVTDADQLGDGTSSICGYPRAGFGFLSGEVIEPFELETCQGDTVRLEQLWCAQGVTVIHLSTAWCSLCQSSTSLLQQEVMAELTDEPVTLVEILLEGEEPGETATTEDCQRWTEAFLPRPPTYIPPDGQLDGPLAEVATTMRAPSALILDSEGEIRFRTHLALPEMLEAQTTQLLFEIREILEED